MPYYQYFQQGMLSNLLSGPFYLDHSPPPTGLIKPSVSAPRTICSNFFILSWTNVIVLDPFSQLWHVADPRKAKCPGVRSSKTHPAWRVSSQDLRLPSTTLGAPQTAAGGPGATLGARVNFGRMVLSPEPGAELGGCWEWAAARQPSEKPTEGHTCPAGLRLIGVRTEPKDLVPPTVLRKGASGTEEETGGRYWSARS